MLVEHPALLAEIQVAVDGVNAGLAAHERVERFRLLATPWTAEAGELTPTLKIRRPAILARYADDVARLYPDGG